MRKREAEAGAKKLNARIGQEAVSVYPVGRGWGVGAPIQGHPDSYVTFNCDLRDIEFEVQKNGNVRATIPVHNYPDLEFL